MTTASDEREIFISRVLVLNLSGKKAVPGTAQDIFALDTAFILIEGQPSYNFAMTYPEKSKAPP